MISFEEVGAMVDDIALSLPKEIYIRLNGGINLLPDIKLHPKSIHDDLFILGDYHNELFLGRFINIYYGSFVRVYGNLPAETQRQKLKDILCHEFTHHLESLAGDRSLIVKDEEDIARYNAGQKI